MAKMEFPVMKLGIYFDVRESPYKKTSDSAIYLAAEQSLVTLRVVLDEAIKQLKTIYKKKGNLEISFEGPHIEGAFCGALITLKSDNNEMMDIGINCVKRLGKMNPGPGTPDSLWEFEGNVRSLEKLCEKLRLYYR